MNGTLSSVGRLVGHYALSFLKDGTELTLNRADRSQVEAWLRQPI
jgi:hypothetical protein